MKPCKRMEVKAIGITSTLEVHSATNYNETECKNIKGGCGCRHAEDALLRSTDNIQVVIVSHSPCLDCAKLLVERKVKVVIYKEKYRIRDGIDYLLFNGVKVVQV